MRDLEKGRRFANFERAFGAQILAFSKATKNPAIEQMYLTQGHQAVIDYLSKTHLAAANVASASDEITQFEQATQSWNLVQQQNPPPKDPKLMPSYQTKMRALYAQTFKGVIDKSDEDPGDKLLPDGYSDNQMLALYEQNVQQGIKPDFGSGKAGQAALHHYNLVMANHLMNGGQPNMDYNQILQTTVDNIGTYRQKPPTGYAAMQPRAMQLMAMVHQKYPNYDDTQYNAKNATVTAFDKGKQGDRVASIDTSALHINTLIPLIQALNNGDVQMINRYANSYATHFGGPAPTNFAAAKLIVGDEINKAIIGGAGALGDRESLQSDFNSASSPAQLMGVVNTLKNLLSGQLLSLQQQFTSSTGLDPLSFQVKLLPVTKQMFLANTGYLAIAPSGGSSADDSGEGGDDSGGGPAPDDDTGDAPDDTSDQYMPSDNSDIIQGTGQYSGFSMTPAGQ